MQQQQQEVAIAQACSPSSLDDDRVSVVAIATQVIGTALSFEAPLMSSGLDSIATMELSTRLGEHLGRDLPSTLLFDHPSLGSIVHFLASVQGGHCETPCRRKDVFHIGA